MEITGLMQLLKKGLKPLLASLGISESVIPITLIGITSGILYGGGLMIEEAKKHQLSGKEVFFALSLMGLCHSLIEDSILMMLMGAHWTGVFVFRILFALIITKLIVILSEKLSDTQFQKLFLNRNS